MLLQIFLTAANAVLPIVLLIAFGYLLRQKKLFDDVWLGRSSWLVFHCFLPVLLFINVYDIDRLTAINWPIVLYALAAICTIFLLGLMTAVLTTPVAERRGVILQCTFRSNFAIIGLPLAAALGGEAAVSLAAVLSAFTIPLFNMLAVVSLSIFVKDGDGQRQSVRTILCNIAKNPLIRGIALGFVFLLMRSVQTALFGEVVFSLEHDFGFLYSALCEVKALTSPLALIVMGGQFRFAAVRGMFREIAVGTIWRIALAPALGIGGAIALSSLGLLSCGYAEYPALIALFGSPVAVSSAIMATGMRNDEQLATQLVVWTSVGSIVTVFLTASLLMLVGFVAV